MDDCTTVKKEKPKVFNVKDGTAIKAIQAMGIKFGVVSGRNSDALQKRTDERLISVTWAWKIKPT